jgi:exopolysaccharide production protein ExoZ
MDNQEDVTVAVQNKKTGTLPTTFINIQFLRFAASMLVVFYHTCAHVRDSGTEPGYFFSISEAVGFAGVDIFFVISGFIMAYTTRESSGCAAGVDFARRRVARVYSGYWPFYLIAIALFAWIGGNYLQGVSFWRSALLLPGGKPLIAVSWTLIYEMYFYILFTLLIFFVRSRRILLLTGMSIGIVAWSLYSQFVRHAYDEDHLVFLSLSEAYMLSPYLMEFLGGALLAGWLVNRPTGLSWSLLIGGIAIFLAGGWINNAWFDGMIEQGYFIFWRVLVFGTASLFLLAGLVRLEFLGRSAPLRFSVAAGGASYALYLCHIMWLTASQYMGLNSFLRQYPGWIVQLAFFCYAIFILYYSIAHYRIIEKPFHRQCRRWIGI